MDQDGTGLQDRSNYGMTSELTAGVQYGLSNEASKVSAGYDTIRYDTMEDIYVRPKASE